MAGVMDAAGATRQQAGRFVQHYTNPKKDTFGNGSRSAIAAGYAETRGTETGARLVANGSVRNQEA